MLTHRVVVSASLLLAVFLCSQVSGQLVAFPTAEGYGRFAQGGRGGRVIEVTNLNDNGPGSLREAVEATGPRTVVFAVSGTITLEKKLVVKKANSRLTVAGQTAPGNGICVSGYTFGMMGADDVIIRFIRTRVGTVSGLTMDGMGMASSNNCIFDHCSISWSMDEAFSSRGAGNITLQRTLISEALNQAGHSHYGAGAQHGFAASISGNIGSFHHNLIADCAGRNWSMAGTIKDGKVYGKLDITNNVVYNWKHRTTDGEINMVNFVNNYYKPGPASLKHVAMTCTFSGWAGQQLYYLSGNVMPGYFGPNDVVKSYATEGKAKPPTDYKFIVSEPVYPSYVTTESAEEAYKDVLANVGCNVPSLDEHDKRIVREVREGTYTYKGSKTGLPGIPDNEADVGGLENYPVEKRADGWDSDHDGMPDAWEKKHGLDPKKDDASKTGLSADGYTNLEMYLNELAGDPVKWTK
jgi:hypothetical protein